MCSAICQWSQSRRTRNHALLSLLGSLSVASYDSQGLRWKYSCPPPHGDASGVDIKRNSGVMVLCKGRHLTAPFHHKYKMNTHISFSFLDIIFRESKKGTLAVGRRYPRTRETADNEGSVRVVMDCIL
jgi:hypothetical protein